MTREELRRKIRSGQRKSAAKQRKKRFLIWMLIGALLTAAAFAVFLAREKGLIALPWDGPAPQMIVPEAPADGVRAVISVIDVGQGSAMLIQSGGEAMLVDGGGREYSSKTVAYLKAQGVTRLKYLVATHYDADHLYGAIGALEAVGAETVLVPDYEEETYVYQSFRQHLENRAPAVLHPSPGDAFDLGYCRFTVLAPCGSGYEAENDYSIALRLTDGVHSLLVTGDAEAASEAEMVLNSKGDRRLASDVYVAGHHGSASSSGAAFLAAVKPSFAVISCGAGNDYGHPKAAVMSRLRLSGCGIYRTDKQGDIVFRFTDDGILFEQEPTNDYTPG